MPNPIFGPNNLAKYIPDPSTDDTGTPSIPAPQQKGSMFWPAAMTIGGNAADIASTMAAINGGRGHEANPVLGSNPNTIAAVKGLATIPEIYVEKKLNDAGHPLAAKLAGAALGGLGGLLAIHNSQVGK